MGTGAVTTGWMEYRHGWSPVEGEVIEEALVTIYLNGRELATIMCTPRDQDKLALGFLKNEGLIDALSEVQGLHLSRNGCCVDVWLDHGVTMPKRVIITSGCGGGVTFDDPSLGIPPVTSDLRLRPDVLPDLLNQLHYPGSLHARTRGVHAAGLAEGDRLLVRVEDVGRHNTIDKLRGACMQQGGRHRGTSLAGDRPRLVGDAAQGGADGLPDRGLPQFADIHVDCHGRSVEHYAGRIRASGNDARLRAPGASRHGRAGPGARRRGLGLRQAEADDGSAMGRRQLVGGPDQSRLAFAVLLGPRAKKERARLSWLRASN